MGHDFSRLWSWFTCEFLDTQLTQSELYENQRHDYIYVVRIELTHAELSFLGIIVVLFSFTSLMSRKFMITELNEVFFFVHCIACCYQYMEY